MRKTRIVEGRACCGLCKLRKLIKHFYPRKGKIVRVSQACIQCSREYTKRRYYDGHDKRQYRLDHPEVVRKSWTNFKARHSEKLKQKNLEWRRTHPDQSHQTNLNSDCYLKRLLVKNTITGLLPDDVPPSLVELKKLQMNLWRKLPRKHHEKKPPTKPK